MYPSTLLLAFPDNTIQIYDVEARQFPPWGKEVVSNLPTRFTHAHDPILGVAFDPAPFSSHPEQISTMTRFILIWGATWLFKVTLDMRAREFGRKRRRDPTGGVAAAGGGELRDDKMIMRYRPIVCCDFLARDELVVVERPLVDVLATLPSPYFKHKYGAS